jgi:hypothetical protein
MKSDDMRLLIETLLSDNEFEDESVTYQCSVCGHKSEKAKYVYKNVYYPCTIIASTQSEYITLNLIYSNDFTKIKEIRVEYKSPTIQDYSSEIEDTYGYKNNIKYVFYYKNGMIIKTLSFFVDTHMYNRLFGCYISTYDIEKDVKTEQAWNIYDVKYFYLKIIIFIVNINNENSINNNINNINNINNNIIICLLL